MSMFLLFIHFVILFQLLSVIICIHDGYFYHSCIDKYGNYTKDSTYKANLNTLMSSISSDTRINYGFYNFSVGQGLDKVNAIALCRGDLTMEGCHTCLGDPTFELPILCPTQKEAIVFYDNCTLRYSNRFMLGVKEEQPISIIKNGFLVPEPDQFKRGMKKLMGMLQTQAASGDSQRKFATGEANVTSCEKVYGLSQCSPDLSRESCITCLGDLTDMLLSCCINRTGVRVLGPSCMLRYEFDLFYNMPSTFPPLSFIAASYLGKGRGKYKTWIIVVILLLLFILLPTLVCCFLRRKRKMHKEVEKNHQIECVDSLQFDFNTIQVATDNFSDTRRIGEGGFSIVYKGELPSGQEVAVKRLHKLGRDGEAKFNNEILFSANLQHKNLVKFIGFCVKKDLRLLIYEFVPNGSFDWFLDDPAKRAHLDWGTRCKVIQGIARGLLYLHEDSQVRVIHRDLKPSNILLSVGMNPKISNFCKASQVHADHTRGDISIIRGTFGYMPPEYVLQGNFSIKSDVFSFGVILLEIISGQMVSRFSDEEGKESLPIFAWRKWSEGKALDIVDQTMSNIQNHTNQITRCIKIALLCAQGNPTYRPKMSTVVLMLNSDTVPIPEPSKPGFMIHDELGESLNHNNSQINKSHRGSVNGASISDLEPR